MTGDDRRPHRRIRSAVLGALLTAWLMAGLAATTAAVAGAHAYLVSTDPANGATVGEAPAAVTVRLSESVSLPADPTAINVVDGSGTSVIAGAAEVSGSRLTIKLRPGLGTGVYVVTWRLISADSHEVAGCIQFGVGVPAMDIAPPAADDLASTAQTLRDSAIKAIVYAGLVASVGWLTASWLLPSPTSARVIRAGAAVAIVGTVVQGVALPEVAGGLASGFTAWLALRVVALSAVALVPKRRPTAITASVVALLTTTRVGHGAASVTAWMVTTVHAASAVVWLGGLGVLVTGLLRRRLAGSELVLLRRWSVLAAAAVTLLLVSGVWRAFAEVGFVQAIWSTTYGQILLAKLAAVAVSLTAALAAASWLRRQPGDGEGPAPGQTAVLRRRAWIEAGAVGCAMLVAVLLSNLTPATVAFRPSETVHVAVGPYRADVRIYPARTGPETVAVTVTPTSSVVDVPARLSGVLRGYRTPGGPGSNDTMPVQFPIRVTFPAPPGESPAVLFRSAAVPVAAAGRWTLDLTVVVDQWSEYVARVGYDVR